MQEPKIPPEKLEIWADYLLSHSLGGVGPGDRVMIKGERSVWPLMAVLERKVAEAGGVPDVYLIPPNNERGRVWSATMGRSGSPAQHALIPDWHRARYESMTKYVEVLGAESPTTYAGLAEHQSAALARADRPFTDLRFARPWVITLYPTAAFAATEGMSLEEYADFLVRASTVDPRPLREAEERLAPLIRDGKKVRLITHHPRRDRDLTLEVDIEPSIPTVSYGLRNFPDGEVFTSPDANKSEGEIYLDLPVHYGGEDIRGIYLQLKGGRIVSYDAEQGRSQLAAIVETDDGSHRLGEVAFGMNPGLDRVLKHPLLVEKVGGTAHIAIGASYDACYVEDPQSPEGKARIEALAKEGILNRSARHVDVVADFRPGGVGRRIFIDDRELVVRDRVFVPV